MWRRIALIAAALGAATAIVIVIVISRSDSETPAAPADIQLQLGDYFIRGDLEVPAGDVELEAVNVGVQPHNVGIRGGPITTNIAAAGSTRLDLGVLSPGDYELYCDVADHVARGMVATLHVT
jgi:plastocyanin